MVISSRWCMRFLVAAVVVFAACTSQPVQRTTIDRVLKAPEVPNAPYATVVIIGAAPNRAIAREFESGLLQELKEAGINAHSFVRESSATQVSEQAVAQLVNQTGADGIIFVSGRLAGAELDEHSEQVDMDAQTMGGNLVNYFRYDYEEFTRPSYSDISVDVNLEANFFDAATNTRVHSMETSTTHGATTYEVVVEQSKAMVRRLKKDGIL